MAIKHTLVSGKADGGDATLVQPSNWNANHTIDSEVTFPVAATPATPAAGSFNFYGKLLGNTRVMPAAIGPSGMDYAMQPALFRQKISLWSPGGNANTVPGVFGFAAMTVVGTATARNVATTNIFTRMRRSSYVSAATTGSACSIRSASMFTSGTGAGLGGFYASFRFGVSDAAAVAGARMFVGVDSATPTNVEMSTRTNNFGIAQLSTDTTQLYLVYGGSAAQTAVALGTGFPCRQITAGAANGIPYDFQIWCPPSSNGVFNWQLDRLDTGTSTSGTVTPGTPGLQTPANTTLLSLTQYRTNNATALAVALDTSTIYAETDY
jgi:hypothetical protein